MKNVKHKKYKNTGLIYEMLIRKITSEVVSGDDVSSVNILKEHFSKGKELQKELSIYRALYKQRYNKGISANDLINTLRETRKKLNENKLKKEKYNLVKSIKESIGFDNLFSIDIPDYKIHASIYNLLEYDDSDNPVYITRCKENLLEHITQGDEEEVPSDIYNEDPNLLETTYNIFVSKFNEKYSKFSLSQKNLLKEYINNPDNSLDFKDYFCEECVFVKNKLNKFKRYNSDESLNIKIENILEWLDTVQDTKFLKENHISTLLKYQELLNELNIKDERFTK